MIQVPLENFHDRFLTIFRVRPDLQSLQDLRTSLWIKTGKYVAIGGNQISRLANYRISLVRHDMIKNNLKQLRSIFLQQVQNHKSRKINRTETSLGYPTCAFRDALYEPGWTNRIDQETYEFLTSGFTALPGNRELLLNIVGEGCYRLSWEDEAGFYSRLLSQEECENLHGLYLSTETLSFG